jgi:aminoglycoside phosphotransferase (APT) family kinase protein
VRAEDLDLVRRESDLPGLALLLDGQSFAERLNRSLPELESVRGPTYLRHKPGTSCIAAYAAEEDGRPVSLYAKAFRPADGAKRLKAMRRAKATGHRPLAWDDAEIAVCPFPVDLELPTLAALDAAPSREALLRKVMGPAAAGLGDHLLALHHRPERRFVARLEGHAGDAAIKLHAAAGFAAAKPAAKAFASHDNLLVPRMLGRSHRHGVVVSEWLVGDSLDTLPQAPSAAAAACRAIGAALATLHAQAPAALRRRARDEVVRRILAVSAYLGVLIPAQAPRLDTLGRRLAAALHGLPDTSCGIHGDFHPHQVLLRGDVVVILDLDEAVLGDPADDLGTFLAHLERTASGPAAPGPMGDPRVARDALLAGYDAAGMGPRVDVATAAALFLLAPHPFRARESEWPLRIDGLVTRAEGLLVAAAHRRRTTAGAAR